MKFLVWDTSSKTGAVAALEWDPRGPHAKLGWASVRLAAELSLNVDAAHSERLLWGVDQALEASGWKLPEIDFFGVGVGPGSFTGLRIGLTTARTLAHTTGKPLIGVSSLAALARPVARFHAEADARSGGRTIVVAATDACKGELFALWGSAKSLLSCAAWSDSDHPGLWKRGVEEAVLAPEALARGIKRKLAEGKSAAARTAWCVVGEGRHRYEEEWKKLPRAKRVDPGLSFGDHVQGRALGELVWEAHQAGLARPALQVHPRYVRASDAELKLKAGLLPKGPTRGEA